MFTRSRHVRQVKLDDLSLATSEPPQRRGRDEGTRRAAGNYAYRCSCRDRRCRRAHGLLRREQNRSSISRLESQLVLHPMPGERHARSLCTGPHLWADLNGKASKKFVGTLFAEVYSSTIKPPPMGNIGFCCGISFLASLYEWSSRFRTAAGCRYETHAVIRGKSTSCCPVPAADAPRVSTSRINAGIASISTVSG